MYSERTVDGIERGAEQYFKRYNGTHPELGLPERQCRVQKNGLETRQRWAEVQNAHPQQYVTRRGWIIAAWPTKASTGHRNSTWGDGPATGTGTAEALLERRAAEDELQHSQRALAPFDLRSTFTH